MLNIILPDCFSNSTATNVLIPFLVINTAGFSGSSDIKFSRLEGAASYDVQITQLDPTVEANWAHTTTSKTASHIQLTGLTPGQSYWLRMRGIGTNGVGLWIDPLNIMVV